jgi:hypothetical protein
MGQLVEQLAPAYGCEVAGVVTSAGGARAIADWPGTIDVAIDFTLPDAVAGNLPALAARGWNVERAWLRACNIVIFTQLAPLREQ